VFSRASLEKIAGFSPQSRAGQAATAEIPTSTHLEIELD
jgi:hypothetical protein